MRLGPSRNSTLTGNEENATWIIAWYAKGEDGKSGRQTVHGRDYSETWEQSSTKVR